MKIEHDLVRVIQALALLGPLAVQTAVAGTASVLDHEVRLPGENETVNLQRAYAGKVVLIVNTASRCAYTDQYDRLEDLYRTYSDRGLVVLGFPSNDFGNQEPGSAEQIKDFCRVTYGVRFPMFAKTSVKRGTASPLFKELATAAGRYPGWNFHKYLVGRDGRLVDDYRSSTSPNCDTLVRAIERLL